MISLPQRNRNREVYYLQVLEEISGMPQRSTQGDQGRVPVETGERTWGIGLY